jgi:hypothetical protein
MRMHHRVTGHYAKVDDKPYSSECARRIDDVELQIVWSGMCGITGRQK